MFWCLLFETNEVQEYFPCIWWSGSYPQYCGSAPVSCNHCLWQPELHSNTWRIFGWILLKSLFCQTTTRDEQYLFLFNHACPQPTSNNHVIEWGFCRSLLGFHALCILRQGLPENPGCADQSIAGQGFEECHVAWFPWLQRFLSSVWAQYLRAGSKC